MSAAGNPSPSGQVVSNSPGLSTIAYRAGEFNDFRSALLTPLDGETALAGWRPAPGDLGLQLLEWWAYLADILTFYNERIANETYLRTAEQPANVTALVSLLGYRPRPAIGAVGQVAAIRRTGRANEPLTVPAGTQIVNSATPGVPVQTFETAAASFTAASDMPLLLGASDRLLDGTTNSLLLSGLVTSVKREDELVVVARAFPDVADWELFTATDVRAVPNPNGGQDTRVVPDQVKSWLQTALVSDETGGPAYELLRPTQFAQLWSQTADAAITSTPSSYVVHLSAAVRGISVGSLVLLQAAGTTAFVAVSAVSDQFRAVPYPGTATSPPSPPGGPAQAPQGNWVGAYGVSGYVLAGWSGGQLAVLPGVTLDAGGASTLVWASSTSDIRALLSPDRSTRTAAGYKDPTAIKVQLTFDSEYTGNLHLYAVDWDGQGRRETITVDGGFGSQSLALSGDFSQGAWASFPIAPQAGGVVAITVTHTAGPNAVLSGIFLGDTPSIPVAHTVLTVSDPASQLGDSAFTDAAAVEVAFGFKAVGTLIGSPATVLESLPATVTTPSMLTIPPGGLPAFVEDPTGAGIVVNVTPNADGTLQLNRVTSTPQTFTSTPQTFSLQAPLRLLVDPIGVSRGATVASETLGSGDASAVGQTFTLKQAPLTYLTTGAGYASTLQIWVNGLLWTEVPTFYAQPADATVFVVAELANGSSQVRFGDGLNGARLPTGAKVVASYRYGAGSASPPAGRLTTIRHPQPNLGSVRNPVPVGGGADRESPADIRQNAPGSVLTFGRAISAADYGTVATRSPGVARVRVYWSWDAATQRPVVMVYVGDDATAVTSATGALAGAEDPNRPVKVMQATPTPLTLTCTLVIATDVDPGDVLSAAQSAIADPVSGLFAPANMGIGQLLYASQIESALLVKGAYAVRGLTVIDDESSPIFTTATEPVGAADPGTGAYFTLAGPPVINSHVGGS